MNKNKNKTTTLHIFLCVKIFSKYIYEKGFMFVRMVGGGGGLTYNLYYFCFTIKT